MSAIVYTQRFKPPTYKSTASKNYAHVRYIATRPRVAKNEGMNHGLFGRISAGPIAEFDDWKDIARRVYQNSKGGVTMYRSVISFDSEVALERGLTDKKAWQDYLDRHIYILAEKNGIQREYFQWAAALHPEKGHPHLHVVFWDTSSRIKNPFTPPATPNAIRKQLIKETFADKIRAFGEQKNMVTADLRSISNELVDEFEQHLRRLGKDKYRRLRMEYDEESDLSDSFNFSDKALNEAADRVFKIKAALPPTGRITYQLLPPEVKSQVDSLVSYLLKTTPTLKKLKADYIDSKMNMATLYGGDKHLSKMQDQFSAEADKIIANRILGMVKTLNRLDSEYRSEDYQNARRTHYAEQMLMEALDMLKSITRDNNDQFDELSKATGTDLSKEARKELFRRFQDKGYEH